MELNVYFCFIFNLIEMKTVQQNINDFVVSFDIEEQDSKNIMVKDIVINNDFINTVDYCSNYFSFISNIIINENTPNYIFNKILNTNTNISLFNVLRIPVKYYKDENEIIEQINMSYFESMLNLHKKIFVNKSDIKYQFNDTQIISKPCYLFKNKNYVCKQLNNYTTYDLSLISNNAHDKIIYSNISDKIYKFSTDKYRFNINNDIYISNNNK